MPTSASRGDLVVRLGVGRRRAAVDETRVERSVDRRCRSVATHRGHAVGELVDAQVATGARDRPDAVEARRSTEWRAAGPTACHPDRHATVYRRRAELHVVDGHVFAPERHRFTGPQLHQRVQRLVEDPSAAARLGILSEPCELVVGSAETDPEPEPTARQQIERHRLTCHDRHAPSCEGRHHRADHDSFGRRGDRCERHPRVDHRLPGPAADDVIPQEEPVPAGNLGLGGESCQLDRIGEVTTVGDPESEVDGRVTAHRLPLVSCRSTRAASCRRRTLRLPCRCTARPASAPRGLPCRRAGRVSPSGSTRAAAARRPPR